MGKVVGVWEGFALKIPFLINQFIDPMREILRASYSWCALNFSCTKKKKKTNNNQQQRKCLQKSNKKCLM